MLKDTQKNTCQPVQKHCREKESEEKKNKYNSKVLRVNMQQVKKSSKIRI